ncbi:MAG: DUF5134 domain-containing protein [Pseudonocardiaceae bacterium]
MTGHEAGVLTVAAGTWDGGTATRRVRGSLRTDLRAAAVDAAVAGVLSAAMFGVLVLRVRSGVDAALVEMPSMARGGGLWPYTLSQAFGFATMLWAWGTILLGLSLPTGIWRGRPQARQAVERLHRSTSLTVIALMVAHAGLLIWDHMGDTPVSVFVPGNETYAPGRLPTALGIVALYLAVVVGPSFYLRERLPKRAWAVTHRYVIPAVYALGVWHTFLYGSDVKANSPLFVILWAMQLPVIALFGARLLAGARRHDSSRPAVVIATVVIAGLVSVAVWAGIHTTAMTGMSMANTWLPAWLRILASGAFVVVLLIHVRHLVTASPRGRVWHAGHVLMALGMIDMVAPTSGMLVPAWAGEVIFSGAALAVAGFALSESARAERARGRRLGWLWPVVGIDLAAMVWMFAMPAPRLGWLTGLLVGWFALQATGWATGRLDTATDPGICRSAHRVSVRATLAVMAMGMAYMFLAMQLGMNPMPGYLPSMAGM